LIIDLGDEAPRYGRAPFPTEAVRDGAYLGVIGGLDSVAKQHHARIAAHLHGLNGWGLRPTVEFFFDGELDPATVPERTSTLDDALVVLDVDPDTIEAAAPIAFDWRYDEARQVLAGSPAMGVQLHEGTRYAAVLTTGVKSANGAPVYGAFELARLEHDPPERWRTTAESYAELKTIPQLGGRVAGLAVFTTQRASAPLVAARNAIANTSLVPVPTLEFDDPQVIFDTPAELDALLGTATRETTGPRAGLERWGNDNPTGLAHDHVAVVATGKVTIARFVGADTGTDGPDDETFTIGVGDVPELRAVESIPITIVLPTGPVPADGFPVVVFGHGLGASRHDVLVMAEPLASLGYAVVGIDAWNHGSRLSATDSGNNLGAKPGFTGDRALRDGFGDAFGLEAYFEFFEGFMNFSAIRDSIRQSALDVARVSMLIQTNPSLAALAAPFATAPRFDPTRVAYLGQSFGTIVGTDLAAIEPDIGLYVLNVGGGGMLDYILPNSPYIGELAIPLAEQLYRTQGKLDRFHPVVGMLQAIFDGADSLTYARHVFRNRFVVENEYLGNRHVVLLEVMDDELMPNASTEALARGFGMHVLKPNLVAPAGMQQIESPAQGNVNNQTAILVQYAPATHGNNWSAEQGRVEYMPGAPMSGDVRFAKLPKPITLAEPIYETHAQVGEILQTHFTGQPPRVRSTLAPVADFDGDGKLDAVDPDPYDPAL
jgi:pimeloyl-ACP methyl ester carboxylesterase